MKKHGIAVVFAIAASIVLSGCMGKVRYPNYYTLHVAPPPDPDPSLERAEPQSPRFTREIPGTIPLGARDARPQADSEGQLGGDAGEAEEILDLFI